MSSPRVYAILKRFISNEKKLMKYGVKRLLEIGIGPEFHVKHIRNLQAEDALCPPTKTYMLHLPYRIDLLSPDGQAEILQFAEGVSKKCSGFIAHDHQNFMGNAAYSEILRDLNKALDTRRGPTVFIEYSAGLDFDIFLDIARLVRHLPNFGICLDIGHIGIEYCRRGLAESYPDGDLRTELSRADDVESFLSEMRQRVADTRRFVCDYVDRISKLDVPVHVHLHDGHPLSAFSPYGVCDHLPFYWRIPFSSQGGESLSFPCIFGVDGAREVIRRVLSNKPSELASFTLELHPQPGRVPVSGERRFDENWAEDDGLEKMAYWMDMLSHNYTLIEPAFNAFDIK